jgi:hypothetical protein
MTLSPQVDILWIRLSPHRLVRRSSVEKTSSPVEICTQYLSCPQVATATHNYVHSSPPARNGLHTGKTSLLHSFHSTYYDYYLYL